MKLIFVKPAEGLHLRAPDGTVIPAAGMAVPHDAYVQRRLDAGDLVEADEVAEAPSEATADAAPARPRKETR